MAPVRQATTNDLPSLFELWYDRIMLISQADQSLRLTSDSRHDWMQAAVAWIAEENVEFLVWQQAGIYTGYIVGEIRANEPGLYPEKIGSVLALVIDLHTKPIPGGIGRVLFDALLEWFKEHEIHTISVQAPILSPVEQAFWRGIGAVPRFNVFELRL